MQTGSEDHHHDRDRNDRDRGEVDVSERVDNRACRDRRRVLAFRAWRPRARSGTCWRKMITAIPTVNPSTTGHGTYARSRPSRANEAMSSSTPAMSPTTYTACAP